MALRVLGGRYELVAFVGRGGMGEVWEGRDRVIARRVAVKLLPHDRRDASGAEMFFREARTAGGLNHAGVVTIFDLGQDPDDGTLYLVMEFLAGQDLNTVLREDGLLQVHAAVDWAAQAADALRAAHTAGIVHRDLKPANLMLTQDDRIKVLDFGIARYMAATHHSSKVIGTLAYMAPERFAALPADPRSDLYSLGCVLHELLTGSTPFQASEAVAMMTAHLNTTPEPPSRTRPDIPAALDDLVMALLAKDPDHRPASAIEVCHRLHEVLVTPVRPELEGVLSSRDTKTVPTAPLTGVGPGAPEAPSRVAFAVEDGGPVAFRRRMRRPVLVGLALFVGLFVFSSSMTGEWGMGLAFSGSVTAVMVLLFGLMPSLSFLVRSGLRVEGEGLFLRMGSTTLVVPWQDITSITFTRTKRGSSLTVTAVLRTEAATRVPVALRRPGFTDGRELEYQLISYNKAEMTARATRLQDALLSCSGGRYTPDPTAI